MTQPDISSGRYQILGELGGGGMAVVYEAVDTASGRRLALKRPRSDGSSELQRRSRELFALEFHTLIQLSHPRIVQVFDYGVDASGPFYTMELLDGGDLLSAMPVDWKRACAIASDICSALSLLHSRRIVHRDVSPRNIRCTGDGLAKLIDFGAMTHMGASKELVGTPVYCAPEILNMRALDARTDLYALGASLYYVLTERHAYPVRDFASLPNAWRFGVARPSELTPGIPEALDTLVLDLLQLEPDARPSSAAEVMARLGAIAGTQSGEQLLVAQAYLATPAFVGRQAQLARVKTKAMRALRKRGAVLLADGTAGSGRSRFLDACLLSSKLLGMTVVRADADDGESDYGVMRRLLSQLQQIVPEVMHEVAEPVLPVLAHIVPELGAGRDVALVPAADRGALRPQLQAALQQVLLAVAERKPLLLAIDDLHAIDEPSLAAIGLIAQNSRRTPLVILATAVRGETPTAATAFQLFASMASDIGLENLTQEESQSLLASVFGASRTLDALAQRLHALSGGSPRDLMRLAQHLVDSGSARYHAGTWSLPAGVEATELPSSVAQMLSGRLAQLPPCARDLARALALCPEKSFSFEECGQLSERAGAGEVLADLEALMQADVVRALGDRFVLADRAWVPLLGSERTRDLHRRLAHVFEVRPDEEFRHARHLLHAGEIDRALDGFVAHSIASRAVTDHSPEAFHKLLLSLPADWFQTYEEVLRALRERRRPKRDEFVVLARVCTMTTVTDFGLALTVELNAMLKQASGLTDWEQADPTLDQGARRKHALGQAQARYVNSPEHERFADPGAAIRELATSARLPLSISALAMDLNGALTAPSVAPFIPLAPVLGVIEQLTQGVQARLSGRFERAHEIYTALLELFAVPERTGIDATHLQYTRMMVMNGRAVIDAAWGSAACVQVADQLEKHVTLQSNAWLIRMVHQLWQGNSHEAERCRKQFDLARVQNSAAQTFESVQLPWQLIAHIAMEDLTRVQRSLEEIAPLAARFPAFRIAQRYGEAEYQRIRGDAKTALAGLTDLLRSCAAGTHQMWPQLAAAHVRALDEAGHESLAAEQGRTYLAEAARVDLGASAQHWISLALCVIEAKLGRADAAQAADAVIEHCTAAGATGLRLGLAYEARARVAMLQADVKGFETHRALCEREYTKAANPALSSKLQRLKREAQKHKLVAEAPMLEGVRAAGATAIKSRLNTCNDATERARVALALLTQQSGASEGHIYQLRHDVPTWIASSGARVPDEALHAMAREYVMAELHGGAQSTGASELSVNTDWTTFGETSYRPVLLSHYVGGACTITGLAVLVVPPDRPFVHPGEVATQISRLTQEAGDVTGLLVSED
ncbi:MAG TPA: protein kinase [Polyangiales bacterium]|nr:protein kinase [Polyangiales bacterium]